MERIKLINAALSQNGINQQQYYLDDRITELLDLFADDNGGSTPDDLLQLIVLDFMIREKPELIKQVFGSKNLDAATWLDDYRFNRFEPAYERGCELV